MQGGFTKLQGWLLSFRLPLRTNIPLFKPFRFVEIELPSLSLPFFSPSRFWYRDVTQKDYAINERGSCAAFPFIASQNYRFNWAGEPIFSGVPVVEISR